MIKKDGVVEESADHLDRLRRPGIEGAGSGEFHDRASLSSIACRRLSGQRGETECRSVTSGPTEAKGLEPNLERDSCSDYRKEQKASTFPSSPISVRRSACIIKLDEHDNAHSRFGNYLGVPVVHTHYIKRHPMVRADYPKSN